MAEVMRTAYRKEKEARDAAITQEYDSLMSHPGAMSGAVETFLMEKYNIHGRTTLWSIRKKAKTQQQ